MAPSPNRLQSDRHSATAQRVALRRAAHQILDKPTVFHDPVALRIIGEEDAKSLQAEDAHHDPGGKFLRAFLVARSRYAEDELSASVSQGVKQLMILGAGLDTFGYRNPFPDLRVFEVDHPATQSWKQSRLEEEHIEIPPTLTFVPVDFEQQTLDLSLRESGFDAARPAFVSWLGVTPYLTPLAFNSTLEYVSKLPVGSEVVFDYAVDPTLLSALERTAMLALESRVSAAGEPFQLFLKPDELVSKLRGLGFTTIEDLGSRAINARYFEGRHDGLQVLGNVGRFLSARL